MVAPFQTPFITALALSPAVLATLASVLPAKQDADGWQAMQAAPPDHRMTFNIVLKGRNPDQLHDKMLYIARTRSNWLTSAELGQYVSPLEEAQGAVQALLSKHGVVKEHVVVNRLQNVWTVEADVGTVSSVSGSDKSRGNTTDILCLFHRRRCSMPISICTAIAISSNSFRERRI